MRKNPKLYQILWHFIKFSKTKQLYTIAILLFFQTVLDILGVSSFFPYVQILQDPGQIQKITMLKHVYHMFNFSSTHSFYIFCGIFIFFLIIVRGVLILYNYYLQGIFYTKLRTKLSLSIMQSYLNKSYTNLLSIHSGEISKNLLLEVNNAVTVVKQSLQVLMCLTTAFSLFILLLFIQPLVILSVFLLVTSIIVLVSFYTKPITAQCSISDAKSNRDIRALVSDVFTSIKDIKVFNVAEYFVEKFEKELNITNQNAIKFLYISNFPGVILNVLAFGLLIFVLLSVIVLHGNLKSALPVIAVIGLAAQRLLPLMTQIYNATGLIKQYEAGARIVHNLLVAKKEEIKNKNTPSSYQRLAGFNHSIFIKNLSFKYRDKHHNLYNNLSFKIMKNQLFCIIGPSGVGKTTLVDILLGLFEQYEGDIFVDNVLLSKKNISSFRNIVGYVPQFTGMIDATLKENIAFGVPVENICLDSVSRAARQACLENFINQLPLRYDTEVGEQASKLSGGQRQRLGIARALYKKPELLILDEPTSSLDDETEKSIVNILLELKKNTTIVLITHKRKLLSVCDSYLELDKSGRVISKNLTLKEDVF